MAYNPLNPNGQATMANSQPVVIASDQKPVSVAGTVGASIIGSVPVVQSGPWSASVVGAVQVSSVVSIPGTVSSANSSTVALGGGAAFTGTSENVKDFSSITVSVFADQASATDGLSIQQSSNGTNWDITDTYTIAASTGKTFSVQPAASFFRIVYTNGATPQGAFRLQTVYHVTATRASSQRPGDAYTNETDLEQVQAFGMVFNGTTWDRLRGTVAAGILVNPGSSSILSQQVGTRITSVSGTVNASVSGTAGASVIGTVPITQSGTIIASISGTVVVASIVGTYPEDTASAGADPGIGVLFLRNDTVASVVGTDKDYTFGAADSAGRPIIKPFSAEESAVRGRGSVVGVASVALIAAPGAGLRNYITDVFIRNTGATASGIDITDGDGSVIGMTIAPAGGGSNMPGLMTPMKPSVNQPVNLSALSASSVITAMVYGYKAP